MATGIAGVLQLIQQQQAAEERKEARQQNLALTLLSMEMREAESARSVLLKEYYNKRDEVAKTEEMFDKYSAADPDYKSPDGMDMIKIVDEQNKIDMGAVVQNLDSLTTYENKLEASLFELESQGQKLQELQSTINPNTGRPFWGVNKILQPFEYRQLKEYALTPVEEGGLGWPTTAGADVEYYKTDPSTREIQSFQFTEKLKKDTKVGAEGTYAILQAMYTPGEGENTDDLVDKLTYEDVATGKDIEPSEEVVSAIQSMAAQSYDYDDFLTNLNAYPASGGGDLIRAELLNNPNTAQLFSNLKTGADLIRTLDDELAGINQRDDVTDFDRFVADISGVTNEEALFGLYDEAIAGRDPALHDKFFDVVEAQLGGIDAGKAYMKYKGFYDPPDDPPDDPSKVTSELETSIEDLSEKLNLLWESGFHGTEAYENISDSLKVLNQELRQKQTYENYVEELNRKLSQGIMTEEELSELSSLVDISVEDLKAAMEKRHQREITRAPSPRRAFYEAGLQE